MSRKKWVVKSFDKEKATSIAENLNISPYAALIALTRGVDSAEKAMGFFGITESSTADPMNFTDMDNAVKRIHKALDNFERIAVYGDYDCDGVTATALLYSYLEMQGADVVYYVPDRHLEGYGLSYCAIDKISRMGAKLIVTVDNGISAVDEAKYIKELEMELIVTDHHLPSGELPQATAIVDPHRTDCNLEFKDYAGVGVAYKLICALEGEENELTASFLDLVALGTIGDVMPLSDENRFLVRCGVRLINDSERAGIQALIEVSGLNGKTIGSTAVAFGLVPRINAAGRMGLADRAIKLLLSDDYDEAADIAGEINEDNLARQKIEQSILNEAISRIESNPRQKYDSVIVADADGWHDGVIGIVASRLVEKYGKPAIVITRDGDMAKGSGRSINGFSLYDALVGCKDILTHFGGHKLAAGLGLETSKIDEFRDKINEYAAKSEMPFPEQTVDFRINPSCVNTEILGALNSLEPFGSGNPQPVFGLYNMTITDIQPIGNAKHLRLTLRRNNVVLTALKFRMTQLDFPFCVGDIVDAAVTFEGNEYLGQLRLNILIKNLKIHDTDEDKLFYGMRAFSSLMSGNRNDSKISELLPDRNHITQVYKFIRTHKKWRYDTEMLCYRMGLKPEDYARTAVAVEALCELGTLEYDGDGNLTLPDESVKVNLDDAPVLIRIKSFH